MKRAILAAAALMSSSFTPIALPVLVTEAAAELPSPNVLLCTDNSLLGPSQNRHFWGTAFLLPVNFTTTFEGPFSSGDTEYFIATTKTTKPVIQRCPVLNAEGKRTGKHQDIVVAPADTVVEVFNCQHQLTAAGIAWGYVECPTGGSPDDRNPNK